MIHFTKEFKLLCIYYLSNGTVWTKEKMRHKDCARVPASVLITVKDNYPVRILLHTNLELLKFL